MIFDKDYDNSLWCIIAGDKKNRNRILDFIKSIPNEFLEQIRYGIKQYEQQSETTKHLIDIEDSIETNEGILYSYQIDGMGTLSLYKSIKNEKYYYTVFQLDLLSFHTPYDDIENFNDEWLGNITYNIKRIYKVDKFAGISCDESEYDLIKTPFGYLLTYSCSDTLIIKLFVKFINLKKLPNDLNINDLNDLCKPKVLTKKR